MEASTYAVETNIEADHWWFRGRRVLIRRMIDEICPDRSAAVLDAGTGTGANLRLLRQLEFENLSAVDFSEEAIRHCRDKGLGEVQQGDLCDLPYPDESFQLLLATDILEHIDDDAKAAAELARVLAPGGAALLTVPAFPSLWGLQDQVAHHKRRYRMGGFRELVRGAGLQIERSFYFNYLLFAPIFAARQAIRVLKPKIESENQVNTPLINSVLRRVFAFDVWSAPRLRPPVGVSIMVIARKPSCAE